MKFLFIVNESESANGVCTKAVMRLLAKDNEVICITNREYGYLKEFEEDFIKYFTIVPRLVCKIESYMCHTKISPKNRVLCRFIMQILNKAKLAFSIFSWPLISPLYTSRIYRKAHEICKEKNIDVIVPVYTQIDTLIAATLIKKIYPNIEYIPYFLDSFSGGYGPRYFTEKQIRNRGLKWEKKLLSNADYIIFMESSRKHHERYSKNMPYYHKIRFFDLPLLFTYDNVPENQLLDNSTYNIVYVGSLPSGIRSPEYILKVFSLIKNEKFNLYFIGDENCQILKNAASMDKRIHIFGKCSHKKALQFEQQADILLNLGNSNPNMTPSKIFEYMSFGKPIISTMNIDNESSSQYLKYYPICLVLDERTCSYENAALQIEEFIFNNKEKKINFNEIQNRFYKNSPECVVDFLMECI